MQPTLMFPRWRNRYHHSFTLVELLTVIAIIAILAALTLGAAGPVMNKASRSRSATEIQAMSTALESYKTDNGIYPVPTAAVFNGTNTYANSDGSSAGAYQTSSQLLFTSLAGVINFYDTPLSAGKSYMAFKPNQLGGYKSGTGPTYVKDPWGYSYAYYTATNGATASQAPYNGTGFFDLWSTGGQLHGTANFNSAWVNNWGQ